MKRLSILVFFVVAFILTGCARPPQVLTFTGEGRDWTGTYIVKTTGESHISSYALKYKSSDTNSVGDVRYTINAPTEGTSDTKRLSGTGEITGQLPLVGGLPPKTKPVKIKVEWNGQVDVFNLISK